jgi:hypothetical protein
MGLGQEVTALSKPKKGTAAKAATTETTEKPAPTESGSQAVTPPKAKKAARAPKTSWVEEGGRRPTKARTAPKAPASDKAPKAAPADDPREDLVVFAFRLTQAEREAIHEAAGPAKASRFVRAVALAAARKDMAAIKTAIADNQGPAGA